MTTSERFDFAIVGGGLVGASLAFGLRALGPRLTIVDAQPPAGTASHGNFGLIWVQGKGAGMAPYARWTQGSARAWPRLAAQLFEMTGLDVALRQSGGLHVCLSAQELDARAQHFETLFAQPGFERYEVEMLDRSALARRLPGVGHEVVGGSFCALDGHCNPLRLLRALHAALAHSGVARRTGCRVDSVEPVAGGFRLRTGAAAIETEQVVLAAGLDNARLAPMVGVTAPVKANQGQVIVLERMQAFLPFALETIRQTDEGTVLIGDSQQDRDDTSLDLPVLGAMARRAVQVFPALAGVRAIRAWAALRVMSPDGFPVYAHSTAHPGAFVVGCHSGVTLAAAHAYELAPAILDTAWPDALAPFSPERFADVHAAA